MHAVLAVAASVVGLAGGTSGVSGLHGVVMRGPTMPVCEVGVPCSEPAAHAVLVFSRRGSVIARTRTSATGAYRIRLAAGIYTVRTAPPQTIGRGVEPAVVRVVPRRMRLVDFTIDTGIR